MNTVTRIFVVCFFAACALEAFSRTADAGLVLGTDDASATAYDGNPSWPQDSDGSTSGDPVAFGAWMLSSGNGIAGHFVGGSGTSIDSSGEAFGMFGNNGAGGSSNANREFFGGQGLSVNQKFSVDIATFELSGNRGIDLLDAANNNLFNFNLNSSTTLTDRIFNFMFLQTSSSSGTWMVSGDMGFQSSGIYSGLAQEFGAYVESAAEGGQHNFYLNNLSITQVPEPSTFLTFGCCVMLLSGRRRRKA